MINLNVMCVLLHTQIEPMATQELSDQAAQLSPIQPLPRRPTRQKPVSKVKSGHLHADGGRPFRGRFRVACLCRKTCHLSGGGN